MLWPVASRMLPRARTPQNTRKFQLRRPSSARDRTADTRASTCAECRRGAIHARSCRRPTGHAVRFRCGRRRAIGVQRHVPRCREQDAKPAVARAVSTRAVCRFVSSGAHREAEELCERRGSHLPCGSHARGGPELVEPPPPRALIDMPRRRRLRQAGRQIPRAECARRSDARRGTRSVQSACEEEQRDLRIRAGADDLRSPSSRSLSVDCRLNGSLRCRTRIPLLSNARLSNRPACTSGSCGHCVAWQSCARARGALRRRRGRFACDRSLRALCRCRLAARMSVRHGRNEFRRAPRLWPTDSAWRRRSVRESHAERSSASSTNRPAAVTIRARMNAMSDARVEVRRNATIVTGTTPSRNRSSGPASTSRAPAMRMRLVAR